MLRRDPNSYLAALATFAGVAPIRDVRIESTNARQDAAALVVKRFVNRLIVRNRYNPGPVIGTRSGAEASRRFARLLNRAMPEGASSSVEQRWKDEIATACAGRFEDSNARTTGLTGLDLGELGYATRR
jgi:hypothetical protein